MENSKLESFKTLKVIITDAVSTVKREILTNVWANIDHRLDVCEATNDGQLKFINYVNKIKRDFK